MSTKNIIEKAKRELEKLQDQLNSFLRSTARLATGEEARNPHTGIALDQGKEWNELYYTFINSTQIKTLSRRADALAKVRPDIADGLAQHVIDIAAKCAEIEALKVQHASEKAQGITRKREVSSNDGRYSYDTSWTPLPAGYVIKAGDSLLLSYGNGTQPVIVLGGTQKRLTVKRLTARGTRYATWVKSQPLKRNDGRILGFAKLNANDKNASQADHNQWTATHSH